MSDGGREERLRPALGDVRGESTVKRKKRRNGRSDKRRIQKQTVKENKEAE